MLVWIHGGSFANGSNSVAAYDGSAFARSGVVCVTINYRLAAEGFLFLDDGLANLGLRDQVAALEWVRDNIAAFGGDPGNVTVAGESAGAMSVATLLAMPSAAGLFAHVGKPGPERAAVRAGGRRYRPAGPSAGRRPRRGGTPGDLLAAIGTDWSYALPALQYAEARIAGDAGPTWVYRFDHLEPADTHGFGSCHATEVPFVFRTENHDSVRALIGDHPSPTTAATAHEAWVSFARKGTPGWEPYEITRRTTALMGEKIRVVDDPAPDERHAWGGIR